MHFGRLIPLANVFWSVLSLEAVSCQEESELLLSAMIALFNGLQYMHDHVDEINLDGGFGCRIVADLISAFVESRSKVFEGLGGYALREALEMLSEKAEKIIDDGRDYIAAINPKYYEMFGWALDKTSGRLESPTQITEPSLRVQPLLLFESRFNSTLSNGCLLEMFCSGSDDIDQCRLSDECMEYSARLREKGYVITHQVLYLQLAEMNNCLIGCNIAKTLEKLKGALCSNVLRDAEEIANSGFPMEHQDLFMEQIGLCGLWGFRDFYKPEWLRTIVQWQQNSGCYSNKPLLRYPETMVDQEVRGKRSEVVLTDGCLSHKTAMALMALAATIRFSIEELSK